MIMFQSGAVRGVIVGSGGLNKLGGGLVPENFIVMVKRLPA